ncbi:MAG: cytochrome c biogenesis protein ResB [Syntrophales bacterium]
MSNLKKNSAWSFLSSLKLTIVLFIVITIVSIIGTLVPQGESARGFADHLAPGSAVIFHKLQLFNIYRSVWLITPLILLCLNLVICSWKRFATSWRLFRKACSSSSPAWPHAFENLHPERAVFSKGRLDAESVRMENLLKKKYPKAQRKETEKATCLHGQKGIFSYFGVYIVHLSVLIIIGGVVTGALAGFDAYVEIAEGESTDTVLEQGFEKKKLDFTIYCNRFSLDFYDNGMPKSYQSDLSFLKDNKVVYKEKLLVNHPVTFEGIRFYQSNYGIIPGGKAVITVTKGNENISVIKAGTGDGFTLPENDAKVEIHRIEENFMGIGPAAKISVKSGEKNLQFWIFQHIEMITENNPGLSEQVPLFNPGLFKPYIFSLSRIESKYYTGLKVNRDPGVAVVATGSIFLFLGFMIVFFQSHRQIWIKLESGGEGTRISIAGRSNKDHAGMQRELAYFMGKAKTDNRY